MAVAMDTTLSNDITIATDSPHMDVPVSPDLEVTLDPDVTLDPHVTPNQRVEIQVDPLTDSPSMAFNMISKRQPIFPVVSLGDLRKPGSQDRDRTLRFVCVSDTHSKWDAGEHIPVPDGDVLLHAGDMTMQGTMQELLEFNKYIGRFPHQHKIVIGGNHDKLLDDTYVKSNGRLCVKQRAHILQKYGIAAISDVFTNCTYLQDEMVEIAGIRVYGTPWKPSHHGMNGFSLRRGQQLLSKWNRIPDTVDVLVTHGPPVGVGDMTRSGRHVGCVELLNTVQQRVKPRYHVFGHIHDGYGVFSDGTTTFINASFCGKRYIVGNAPIVFDIDIPDEASKQDPIRKVV